MRSAMKRVRKEETIENNGQCSKKQDESRHKKDPFSILPLDLIVEILFKLPAAKSIARLVFVSKLWSSIIRGKDFTKLYLTRSFTRPRLLFVVFCHYIPTQFLQSFSQEDPSSDPHHRVNISPHRCHLWSFSPPVRGLICRQNDTTVIIGNPSTGQFLTLPRVKSRRRGLFSFFGYDPVNDEYKVLCMTVLQVRQRRESRVVAEEHQVFTLGAKQKWRRIECNHDHLPPSLTKGVCINGVVYYYAWIKSEGSLISFDLISEEFNVIKLPEDIQCLVNYNGKIALASFCKLGTLDLWVLEDASKQEWSKVSLLVPSWTDLVVDENLYFKVRGTLSTGELIFTPTRPVRPFYFISFDLKENSAKKVVVEEIGDNFASLEIYFDHVESPMVLSNVS
ncbi:unnamed protein product [Arabidopsis lyrata]|nr:unnamed protein product [Arabidopsis lyrata]